MLFRLEKKIKIQNTQFFTLNKPWKLLKFPPVSFHEEGFDNGEIFGLQVYREK